MFDLIRLRIARRSGFNLFLIPGFIAYKVERDCNTRHVRKVGRLGNLWISANKNWIYITGSFTTYYMGNNAVNMSLREFKKAVARLSKVLGYDLEKAQVTQFEYGFNLTMNETCETYLERLDAMSRKIKHDFYRGLILETVILKTTLQESIIYNKHAEQKNLSSANLLRFEQRFKKPAKIFQKDQILLEDLLNPSFILEIDQKVKHEFSKLIFTPNPSLEAQPERFSTPKEHALWSQIVNLGGLSGYKKYLVQSAKAIGKKPSYYMINKAKDLVEKIRAMNTDPDPINEMIKKILSYTPNLVGKCKPSKGAFTKKLWPSVISFSSLYIAGFKNVFIELTQQGHLPLWQKPPPI